MARLSDEIVNETLKVVRVVYLNREAAAWWNEHQRRSDDTPIFCGWYSVKGNSEAGPFSTPAACIRDAYYEHILGRKTPSIGRETLKRNPGGEFTAKLSKKAAKKSTAKIIQMPRARLRVAS